MNTCSPGSVPFSHYLHNSTSFFLTPTGVPYQLLVVTKRVVLTPVIRQLKVLFYPCYSTTKSTALTHVIRQLKVLL